MPTLAQAMRNAVDVERSAQRFYFNLAKKAEDRDTRNFLMQMSRQQQQQAQWLTKLLAWTGASDTQATDPHVVNVKSVPGWQAVERIGLADALQLVPRKHDFERKSC
jgi:hypothetical protein